MLEGRCWTAAAAAGEAATVGGSRSSELTACTHSAATLQPHTARALYTLARANNKDTQYSSVVLLAVKWKQLEAAAGAAEIQAAQRKQSNRGSKP